MPEIVRFLKGLTSWVWTQRAKILVLILVMTMVSQDGESNWMEGVMLLAVYAILALAFFYLPAAG